MKLTAKKENELLSCLARAEPPEGWTKALEKAIKDGRFNFHVCVAPPEYAPLQSGIKFEIRVCRMGD